MKTKKFFKITLLVLLFNVVFIILGGVFYAFFVTKDAKLDKNALEDAKCVQVRLFDNENKEMEYFSSCKSHVSFDEISPYAVYAFVSLEDKRFFKHSGIDFKRTIGALLNNLKAGYFKEGGSTITQQLAKNALLSQEKTIQRKLKEAKLALEIEKNYSKEEIITKYLNTIYFGHSLYGITDASKRLFDKHPGDLTPSESAMLAGIVKNPLKNSPLNSIENAIKRRNLVLKLMLEQGYITESEYEVAINTPYEAPKQIEKKNSPYAQAVIAESAKILGIPEREIITNGYRIYTYFDENEQKVLDYAFLNEDLNANNALKTFALSDVKTGGITAYASSINHSPFAFRRQGASTLKPFLSYAPALEQRLVLPDSPILDEKFNYCGYAPSNYQNNYLGWTSVRDSLATSSNACSLRLTSFVGIEYALDVGKRCGLTFDKADGLASILGGTTKGQTIVELLNAYSTLASGGKAQSSSFIKTIYDKYGRAVYTHESGKNRAISEETAYFLTDMLMTATHTGTAKKLGSLPFEVASKTGTNGNSEGNFDAWNLSYTSEKVLAVWYGSNDYKTPLSLNVTGGSYPTITARYVFEQLKKPSDFLQPQSIHYAEIDTYSYENSHILALASENTPTFYRKPIIMSLNSHISTSDYFEDALPNDFSVIDGDGETHVSFTPNPKFCYKVENSKGNVVCETKKGSDKANFALSKPTNFGIELYYLVAYTDDGVEIKRSAPKALFFWY